MSLRTVVGLLLFLPCCGTRSALSDDPRGPGSDVDAGPGADGDANCSDICHRLIVCGIRGDDFETVDECLDRCGEVQRGWSPEAFEDVFGECLSHPCDDLEDCYDDQILEVPAREQHVELCNQFCDRFVACGDPEPDCVRRCLDNEEEAITLFSSEVVDSLLVCLGNVCDDIEECVDDVLSFYGLL